ncbi:MAG: YHS domain-containing (seleno)protein [Cyclobacteriaceae bacterium]
MKNLDMKFICTALIVSMALSAQSQITGASSHLNIGDNLAIEGYDPVSYFNGKKPVKGNTDYQYDHMGATYRFANSGNMDSFKANPEKYMPVYGGWCAYAMGATGDKVEVDPETFKIIDDKLYLFYNFFFNNTLKDWNKDEASLKQKADKNWRMLISE